MKKQIIISLFTFFIANLYSQSNYETLFNWDTINFEENYQYLEIDTSIQNIWQIGEPCKTYFDSAFSKEKAIVTDSINIYPTNNYSCFDLLIGEFNYYQHYSYDIFIEFKHKFDTDSLKDGGYLTVSYDKGETWVNIIEDPNAWCGKPQMVNENLYSESDILFNGEKGFSGRSNGWISTWFGWHHCLVKSSNTELGDTMILRFNFISDNISTNKEGWLIDDIRLYSVALGGAVNESGINETIGVFPNPTNSNVVVDLKKEYKEVVINLTDIMGKSVYQDQYLDKSMIQVNMDELINGIYLLQVLLNKEIMITKKVIKK